MNGFVLSWDRNCLRELVAHCLALYLDVHWGVVFLPESILFSCTKLIFVSFALWGYALPHCRFKLEFGDMIAEFYESEHTWNVQKEACEHGLWVSRGYAAQDAEELARIPAFTLAWELTSEKWTACLPSGEIIATHSCLSGMGPWKPNSLSAYANRDSACLQNLYRFFFQPHLLSCYLLHYLFQCIICS